MPKFDLVWNYCFIFHLIVIKSEDQDYMPVLIRPFMRTSIKSGPDLIVVTLWASAFTKNCKRLPKISNTAHFCVHTPFRNFLLIYRKMINKTVKCIKIHV